LLTVHVFLLIDDAKDGLSVWLFFFGLAHNDGLGLYVSVLHDGCRAAVMGVPWLPVHLLDETGDLEHPAVDLVLEQR
jgi:hypothetical protein